MTQRRARFRIISANLWNGGADPGAFAELVVRLGADAVATQEMTGAQAEALARALPHGKLEPASDYKGTGIALREPARVHRVALPYRDAEHSGVLYTGLAFGKPLVLSAVGGFPEVAAQGAARLVPPEDPAALATTLSELVADSAARERLAASALEAAAGVYSWDAIAAQTLALYRELR